ncbi:MAG: DUF4148 domain-containing protein [Burkholderiaceae bacterium]
MKKLNLIAAALLGSGALLAAPVFAADAAGSKTRAEVVAELAQARASGELAQMNSEDTAQFGGGLNAAAKNRALAQADAKPVAKAAAAATPAAQRPAKTEQARGE